MDIVKLFKVVLIIFFLSFFAALFSTFQNEWVRHFFIFLFSGVITYFFLSFWIVGRPDLRYWIAGLVSFIFLVFFLVSHSDLFLFSPIGMDAKTDVNLLFVEDVLSPSQEVASYEEIIKKAVVPESIEDKLKFCAKCHGLDGRASFSRWPNLRGQKKTYLVKQLHDFKTGVRENSFMNSVAMTLSEGEILGLAEYFSNKD